MTFSYTQISQYLRCPRSYRYRYLDGWREKDSRASLFFGRCFEKALAAFFSGEDSTAALFKEWGAYQDAQLEYSHGDDWERLLRQGIAFWNDWPRIIASAFDQPHDNMQVKIVRSLSSRQRFCGLRRCDRNAGRQALSAGMENHYGTVSGGARRAVGARSSADLLLLDQRDFRCRHCGVCPEAQSRRSSI